MGEVDESFHWDSYIRLCDRILDEMSPRIQKVRLEFTNWRHAASARQVIIDQNSNFHCNIKLHPAKRLGAVVANGKWYTKIIFV